MPHSIRPYPEPSATFEATRTSCPLRSELWEGTRIMSTPASQPLCNINYFRGHRHRVHVRKSSAIWASMNTEVASGRSGATYTMHLTCICRAYTPRAYCKYVLCILYLLEQTNRLFTKARLHSHENVEVEGFCSKRNKFPVLAKGWWPCTGQLPRGCTRNDQNYEMMKC